MHTSQSILSRKEVAGTKSSSLKSTSRSGLSGASCGNGEILGRLHGTTLIERVVGFLDRYNTEQYNRPAYGVR
jgi:hypothetical protein